MNSKEKNTKAGNSLRRLLAGLRLGSGEGKLWINFGGFVNRLHEGEGKMKDGS
jgi:hypothetical protein